MFDVRWKLWGVRSLSAILLITLMGACAGKQKVEEEVPEALTWPPPPEPARIRFLDSYRTDLDVAKEKSFWDKVSDFFAGQKAPVAFKKPLVVHGDARGRIIVGDSGWDRLHVFDPEKREFAIWGEGGPGTLKLPTGITSDSEGRIYVADGVQARVVVFTPEGRFATAYGMVGDLKKPTGVAIDEERKRLYVADTGNHAIAVFELGSPGKKETIGRRGAGPREFNYPTHLTIDPEGNLYVMDAMNFRIQILSPDYDLIHKFGENCDKIPCMPRGKGIGLDSDGNIYVVDAAFNAVMIFDKQGQLLLVFGGTGRDPGRIMLPAGLHVDQWDRVLVADQYNARITRYEYVSEKAALGVDRKPLVKEDEEVEVSEDETPPIPSADDEVEDADDTVEDGEAEAGDEAAPEETPDIPSAEESAEGDASADEGAAAEADADAEAEAAPEETPPIPEAEPEETPEETPPIPEAGADDSE
ncbi:MAG: 6-bladed beta-propeller [Deltaproteobacteria bacterium]|nr:6-bladed beta-propeller [Deltaproteobacteria bacterium]